MHYGILNEEKINIEKFGQEYADYMKRVPRYLLIKLISLGSLRLG